MSEYKRLTLHNLTSAYDYAKSNLSSEEAAKIYDRLAELENKIESGDILIPPCKIRDTVFVIVPFCHNCKYDNGDHCYCKNKSKDKIVKMTVRSIRYDDKGYVLTEDMGGSMCTLSLYCYQRDFGKKWFFDKAKAEARLKELKGE